MILQDHLEVKELVDTDAGSGQPPPNWCSVAEIDVVTASHSVTGHMGQT